MFKNLSIKQKLAMIIVSAVLVVVIIISIFLLLSNNNNPQTEAEIAAEQRANTNIDAGITELLRLGVTSYQIDSMRNGLYLFSRQEDADIARMTINIDSIDRIVNNKGEVSEDYAIFTIKLDGKQYDVRVNLPGMSSAQVLVFQNEKPLFDSGVIDLAAQGIDR